jgi:hypothetical protein
VAASEDNPVGYELGNTTYPEQPSFIADMRSRPGYSGSPVFVYRTQWTDVRTIGDDGIQRIDLGSVSNEPGVKTNFIKFLGVHCAQYHEKVKIKAQGLPDLDQKEITVASAMTIVRPAWRVRDLLELPDFKERRTMRDKSGEMGADAIAEVDRPASSDEKSTSSNKHPNPNHPEDFSSLLNAATKTRPQDDRT